VPEEVRVNCVAQLVSESAQTWWTTVRARKAGEELSWAEFGREFEIRYYSRQH
jgi:hypothetical protein